MYCTNCGAKIEDSAAFCPYCGTPARNREQIPPVTEPPESGRPLSAQSTAIRKKPRRKKAKIIAVVSVSVVIAAAAAIFGLVRLFRNDESYRETVDLFLEANAACDLEEIVELVPDKVVSAMIEGLGYAPLTTREFVEIGQENWNSYLENTEEAYDFMCSICAPDITTKALRPLLFRPPHGHMGWAQYMVLKSKYKIVMWDLVTRDYSKKLRGPQVLANVMRYARNGSIITFHDSLKSWDNGNLQYALPRAINFLKEEGYEFKLL